MTGPLEHVPFLLFERVLIVTGGRKYYNRPLIGEKIHDWQPDLIIHGGASGADSVANEFGRWSYIPRLVLSVEDRHWAAWGRAAGPWRNADLAQIGLWFQDKGCHVEVLAFPGNEGTNGMVDLCIQKGLVVWDYRDGKGD